jgi:acetoin utilization deacetylase AcuC-like enzyme
VVDYFPNRKPSTSWKHVIYVLSPEKHAERVREKMDQVLRQLDDRIRDEERALEESKSIAENKAELPSERSAEEIKKVEASERANDEQLQKLTSQMGDVMKDAMRNKEIGEDTIAQWSKIAQSLSEKASPAIAAAARRANEGSAGATARGAERHARSGEQDADNE